MSVTWIDGREVAKKWKENAAQRTQALIEKGVTPHLAVVVAGENPASQVYVHNKENACNRAAFAQRFCGCRKAAHRKNWKERCLR